MKCLLVVNKINDVLFVDFDDDFAAYINREAAKQGLQEPEDAEKDLYNVDSTVFMQLFSPLVLSNWALIEESKNPCTSVTLENGYIFVFKQVDDLLFICMNGDDRETEYALNRKILIFLKFVGFMFGPISDEIGHSRFEDKKARWNFLRRLLDTYSKLSKDDQCYLVEAVERLHVNQLVNEKCIELLEKVMRDTDDLLSRPAQHSLLLVNTKLMALYSDRTASELQAADILSIILLIQDIFPSSEKLEDLFSRSLSNVTFNRKRSRSFLPSTARQESDRRDESSDQEVRNFRTIYVNCVDSTVLQQHRTVRGRTPPAGADEADNVNTAGTETSSEQQLLSSDQSQSASSTEVKKNPEQIQEVDRQSVSSAEAKGDHDQMSSAEIEADIQQKRGADQGQTPAKDSQSYSDNTVEDKADSVLAQAEDNHSGYVKSLEVVPTADIQSQSPSISKLNTDSEQTLTDTEVHSTSATPTLTYTEYPVLSPTEGGNFFRSRVEFQSRHSANLPSSTPSSEGKGRSRSGTATSDEPSTRNTQPDRSPIIDRDYWRQMVFLRTPACTFFPHQLHCTQILPGIVLIIVIEARHGQIAPHLCKMFHIIKDLLSGEKDKLSRARGEMVYDVMNSLLVKIQGTLRKVKGDVQRVMNDVKRKWDNDGLKNSLLAYLEEDPGVEVSTGLERSLSELMKKLKDLFSYLYLSPQTVNARFRETVQILRDKIRNELSDYRHYLSVKAQRNIPMTSYLDEFPGLVHFIYIDRQSNQLTAPSFNITLEEKGKKDATSLLKNKVWMMVEQMMVKLTEGYTSIMFRDGDFYYSYFLWFEDNTGNPLPVQLPYKPSHDMPPPGILTGTFFRQLIQKCFPNSIPGAVHCYELYLMHVGLVHPQYIASHCRQLARKLWEMSGEAYTSISLL
ncbi:Hermansky-Pudlak syndrome 1 protein homolog [Haliotis rubra]|uniref:Hermansky-Pudlak syndrome 1 protein homolog n=1 Tax=Haliotis rubra TaxID=36100 RepID=UPI001EE55226|nr:Hermansky-Pudlak syndrome 1 protein homolog [Haliotis rubra]